jgi:hypothetical protein
MSKQAAEHHHKAAEHHEHAARHHKEAAKHHEAGKHETAGHHAHLAHGHLQQATHHATEAARRMWSITARRRRLTRSWRVVNLLYGLFCAVTEAGD